MGGEAGGAGRCLRGEGRAPWAPRCRRPALRTGGAGVVAVGDVSKRGSESLEGPNAARLRDPEGRTGTRWGAPGRFCPSTGRARGRYLDGSAGSGCFVSLFACGFS